MIGLLLIFAGGMIELLLIFLGGSILIASVRSYRAAQKIYASTWTFTEARSQGVDGGPYREGPIPVSSLVPRDAPVLVQVAAFSGHALSLYMSVFLPFFLPIGFDFPDAVSLSVIVIAAGVATRRSTLRLLDGSAPPRATSVVLPAVLFMTGVIALLPWNSLGAPGRPQIALVHVVLPIWAAVQAALILASASVARRIAQTRDGLGRQEE
jgi:hypothetical protein